MLLVTPQSEQSLLTLGTILTDSLIGTAHFKEQCSKFQYRTIYKMAQKIYHYKTYCWPSLQYKVIAQKRYCSECCWRLYVNECTGAYIGILRSSRRQVNSSLDLNANVSGSNLVRTTSFSSKPFS